MSPPLVSVCIPARDQARFLGEAIASALGQDIDDLEILVHDDASGDDTADVAQGFGDARIHYLRHERPQGVAENRNSCLRAARGRYVAWLDADDAYLPGALERQVAVLDRHPRVALAHGAAEIVDEVGARLAPWRRPFASDTIEPAPVAFRELILANELTTSTVVVRRAAHELAGEFVACGRSSSDWDMWLRLTLHGDVAYCAQQIACYRQHPATISQATGPTGERLRSDVRVVRRALRAARSELPDRREVAHRAAAALAAKALLHAGDLHTRGRRAAALWAAARGARLAPRVAGRRLPAVLAGTVLADAHAWHRTTKRLLARLAAELDGSRFGAYLARAAAPDPVWDATLHRIARTLRAVTPRDAVIGTVTKWDPTLLHLSGRRGRQFPDRRLLPNGYPPDGAAAVAHLERLQAEGVSHLVFPSASFWWLEHYDALAERLSAGGAPVHADADCVIFELRAA